MSIEGALYDRLSGYAGLSALVSTRIYNFELPQNPTYPAVAFAKIDSSPIQAMGSNAGLIQSRWIVISFAATRAALLSVDSQVIAALDRYSGTHDTTELHFIEQVGSEIDRPSNDIWAQQTEFNIYYR